MHIIEVVIIVCVVVGVSAFFGMAGRTALALLFSPGIYSIAITWPHCWAAPISSWTNCPARLLLAPMAALIGPIAHDAEPPPNPYPHILMIALAIVVAWTAVTFLIKRRGKTDPSG